MQTYAQANIEHCVFCLNVVMAVLEQKELPKYCLEDFETPVFVTFLINSKLNGCIGTFNSAPLGEQLTTYTLYSAFKDTRFQPIKKSDLQNLEIGVSLLRNFESGKKWDNWELGKHGVIAQFEHEGKHYQATYLPEVPPLQNWDKIETMRRLVKKSGCTGPYEQLLEKIVLTTYETSKAKLSFQEYEKQIATQKCSN